MLDEPFGSLDPKNHVKIMEQLSEWANGMYFDGNKNNNVSRALLMISHTPDIEQSIAVSKGLNNVEWEIKPEKRSNQKDHDETKEDSHKENWDWYHFS
jgi:DNA repair exonuclease SbcCD ATPase subunit